jgi:Flp pilus assembly CpaF family ATPase
MPFWNRNVFCLSKTPSNCTSVNRTLSPPSRSQIIFDDLLKAVLRHRPDRIIVGEVHGSKARTLLDVMNTGHRGTLATIHASNVEEAVRCLASLVIRGEPNQQLDVAEEDVCRCIDLIVSISVGRRECVVSRIFSVYRTQLINDLRRRNCCFQFQYNCYCKRPDLSRSGS